MSTWSKAHSVGPQRASGIRIWRLCGLIVAFGWPYLPMGTSPSLASVHGDIIVIGIEWAVTCVLALIGFLLLRRSPGFFGLRGVGVRDMLSLLGLFVATYIVMGIVTRFLPLQTSALDLQRVASVPFFLRLGLVLTAGICEEFIYRGFVLAELADWTGSLWLGAFLSWVLFVLAHIGRYGFTTGLVIPAIVGAAITLLYVWRRNLPACMLMHALFDGLTILLLPVLLK